jgi:hypothetical protein
MVPAPAPPPSHLIAKNATASLELARIDESRSVAVEVVVNGLPVATREIIAYGPEHQLAVELDLDRSSWVALRLLPSLHNQPIFVDIGDRPIRASRRSAQCAVAARLHRQAVAGEARLHPADRAGGAAPHTTGPRPSTPPADESEVE